MIKFNGWESIREFVAEAMDRSRAKNALTPPIMILMGPGGYGKTELLNEIEQAYKGRSPTVRLDFAKFPDANPVEVMLAIGKPLEEHVRGVGSVQFPLLMTGIGAVTLTGDGTGSVADQLAARLRTGKGLTGGAMKSLASNAARLLPSPEQQSLVTEGGAAIGWVVDQVRGHQLGKRLDWYRRSGNPGDMGDNSAYGPLLALRKRWQDSESNAFDLESRKDWRRVVFLFLCRALLADLRVFPRPGVMHGERTTNCLLLLENADTPLGTEFLEVLAEIRRQAVDGADPLVVVAAQGTWPDPKLEVGRIRDSSDKGLRYQEWLSAAQDSKFPESRWWYPVRLAELNLGHVREIVSSHVLRTARNDAKFIHEFTGGNPGAVGELAEVFRTRDPLPADFDLRALVSGKAEKALLTMVRPPNLSDRDLDAMAVFSLTLRPERKASDAVFRFLKWDNVYATDVWERFGELMWLRREEPFEIRPLYRRLLTRWLARDGDCWENAHEGFHNYYQGRNDRVAMNYHQLALTTMSSLTNLRKAADYLTGEFKRVPADQWNDKLTDITAAPNRLVEADINRQAADESSQLPRDPREVVRRMHRTEEQDSGQDSESRVITRLLAARWVYNDLLFDPKRKTALLVERGYDDLDRITVSDAEVFYAEKDNYRKVVQEWEDSW